jgi:hypothetical protein
MPVDAQFIDRLLQAGDRALADVRREAGMPLDGTLDDGAPGSIERYMEALEGKVREQAITLHLAGQITARRV